MDIQDILNYRLIDIEGYKFTVYRILLLLLIYLTVRFCVWLVKKLLVRQFLYLRRNIDRGRLFAIIQLITYFIYIIGTAIALESIGISISIFWAGSAALLVGLGFGLQQTFNDLVSGLILLFEGSVKVGDIIELNSSLIGRVSSIGMRTSMVGTRDSIIIIVPNSKLNVDNVINWTNNHKAARFVVSVGVAYGSDVELVVNQLIAAAYLQKDVIHPCDNQLKKVANLEMPFVRFKNFGESCLDFELLFWTLNVWDIEIVKSDIRFNIEQLFRENQITIAFPQRDIHIRVDEHDFKRIKSEFYK